MERWTRGELCFHFPLVREMQQYTIHLYEATDDFHFPLVREMQRRRPHDPCDYLTFHFPLVREMQLLTHGYTLQNCVFISRLYARCNHAP